MFKTILSIVAAVFIGTAAFTQETEGHVSYNVEFSSKQPEMQMSIGMLQGSKLEMYFTEGKSRTEMKIGTMMQTTTVVDGKKKEMLVLMSGIMGKKAMTQALKKPEETAEKPKVELVDETKEIAGYACKKAIVSDETGNSYTFWYTDKIKATGEGQKYFDGKGLPGFPLQMEISQQGMDIKMTATAYEKLPKKHAFFDLSIPEGYQKMTQEEMEKMMRGM